VLPRSLCDKVDVLRGRPVEVTELAGGLTNRNFKVTTPEGAFVVRLSGRVPGGLAINREHEYQNSVIAAASGVGAPVLSYLPGEAALVIGYIDGRTFTDDDFSRPGVLERVAESCRRLHQGASFVNEFDMFQIQHSYLRTVVEKGYRLPEGYLNFEPDVARIRGALAVRAEPTVACNNDLLAGNFIDDGDRIWLIDYEYSGNNDACFELGNIGSECHLSDDQLDHLVTSYYGLRLANKVARARLQGLMSQYGWTLWASIQQATSDIDFGFWPWGLEKYERAVEMFRGPLLDRLIEDVQRDD
jgi:thiamine kinase-like enzyme